MEPYLIKEGFEEVFQKGAKITKYIADADSATFPLLKMMLPWGIEIVKIDCSNHLRKNFNKFIDEWKKNNKLKFATEK